MWTHSPLVGSRIRRDATRTWILKVIGEALIEMRLGRWRHREDDQPPTYTPYHQLCLVINEDSYSVSCLPDGIGSAHSDDIEHDDELDVSWMFFMFRVVNDDRLGFHA